MMQAFSSPDAGQKATISPGYQPMHFREQIDNGALTFDYRIHHGSSSTRNAIALLQLMGFPKDLVEDALDALEPREVCN